MDGFAVELGALETATAGGEPEELDELVPAGFELTLAMLALTLAKLAAAEVVVAEPMSFCELDVDGSII